MRVSERTIAERVRGPKKGGVKYGTCNFNFRRISS